MLFILRTSSTKLPQLSYGQHLTRSQASGGCFTNVSRALQNNLAKIYNARNHIYGENFKLKLCTCAQSMALGTSANFQLEILKRSAISAIHKFRENILESSRNVSETTPRDSSVMPVLTECWELFCVNQCGGTITPLERITHTIQR